MPPIVQKCVFTSQSIKNYTSGVRRKADILITLLTSMLILAIGPLSAAEETRNFVYTVVPGGQIPPTEKTCTAYFATQKDASEADRITSPLTWDSTNLKEGVIYLNVESNAADIIAINFPVFSNEEENLFIPYTVTVSNISDEEESKSGSIKGEKDASAEITFPNQGGVIDKEYSITFQFADNAFSSVSEGDYSSTVTVEVTML